MLMLILQLFIGLHSQNIDLTNTFAQAYISSGEPVLFKITRYFKSDFVQCNIVLRLKKILYDQDKAARLWYEKLKLFCHIEIFVSKVNTCLFMSKTVICVVYMDDCLFWESLESHINNDMKYLKGNEPSYDLEHSKGELVSELLGIDIKTLNNGIF